MRIEFSHTLTAADTARRTITGRIVTWSEVGSTSAGPARFEPDSIEFADDVRLVREHDDTNPLGRAVELTASAAGIDGVFRIAATRSGDDALVEAADKLRDGLSVGVEVLESEFEGEVLVITAARLDHVGLVTRPAIDSARVTRVAASATPTQNEEEMNNEPEIVEEIDETEGVEVVEVVEAAHRPVVRTRPRVTEYDSAADYVVDYVTAARGDRSAMSRVTAANQVVADNLGIVPKPLVGNLLGAANGRRPIVDSSRRMAMPRAGKVFSRPKITAHTAVGVQATELTALASQKMSITATDLTKVTYGGALTISQQDLDWTDPAILGIVIQDLGAMYVKQTETATATALAAITASVECDPADSAAVIGAIYEAAALVAAGVDDLPDTIWASPDQWQMLGSLVDGSKRPIFPTVGPQNAGGTQNAASFSGNPLGLNLVVSSALAAGSLIVGRSQFLETYEDLGGTLSVVAPSTLGFDLAYYGYFVPWIAEASAFCALEAPAAPATASK
jgi:phage head maturation protease